MSQPKPRSFPDRLAVSSSEAARLVGIGRTKLYEAIGTGELKSLKIGSRRLVAIDALRDWLRTREVASQGASPTGDDTGAGISTSRPTPPAQAIGSTDLASGVREAS